MGVLARRRRGRSHSSLMMVLTRLRDAFITLFIVLVVVFLLGALLGQPEEQLAPPDPTEEQVEAIRDQLGLNRPIIVQFGDYMGGLVKGDFGNSMVIARDYPARSLLGERLMATIKLTIAGIIATLLIGVFFGIIAGVRPGSVFDRVMSSLTTAFVSFPYFWFGLLFTTVFAVNLGWVDVLSDDRRLSSYILPGATLGVHHGGRLFQLVRSAVYDELSKSYFTVATSKGLSHTAVVVRHVMRNVGVVLLTMVGWEYARMWGGTVFVVEFTFAWTGIGTLVTDAAKRHDFPVVQAGVVIAGLFVVLSNLVVDILYSVIDKRVEVS